MGDETRIELSAAKAVSMLDPDAEHIHTYRNPVGGFLLGADWERERLIEHIKAADFREIGGEGCCGMNHGLVVHDPHGLLFVECAEGTDYAEIGRLASPAPEGGGS